MRVIITEKIHPAGIEILKQNCDTTESYGISRQELLNIIGEYDGIVERSSIKLDKQMLDAAKKLKVIGMAGVGLNHIDLDYAKQKGIEVRNVPEGSTNAVAELTVSTILTLARKTFPAITLVKNGGWSKHAFRGMELRGKTLGLIAIGRIGQRVAKLAQAFGMSVIAADPYIDKTVCESLGIKLVSFEEVLKSADVISIHAPLTKETYHMISDEQFNMMKDGVILVNMGRGGIVNEASALKAIKSGKLWGLGMDVVENEPKTDNPYESELINYDSVVVTPHIGAGTKEAQEYIGKAIANKVLAVLKGENNETS